MKVGIYVFYCALACHKNPLLVLVPPFPLTDLAATNCPTIIVATGEDGDCLHVPC